MKKQTETDLSSKILDTVGKIMAAGDLSQQRIVLKELTDEYFQTALEEGRNVSAEYKIFQTMDELLALLEDSLSVQPQF